jgi:hypothetical protein
MGKNPCLKSHRISVIAGSGGDEGASHPTDERRNT